MKSKLALPRWFKELRIKPAWYHKNSQSPPRPHSTEGFLNLNKGIRGKVGGSERCQTPSTSWEGYKPAMWTGTCDLPTWPRGTEYRVQKNEQTDLHTYIVYLLTGNNPYIALLMQLFPTRLVLSSYYVLLVTLHYFLNVLQKLLKLLESTYVRHFVKDVSYKVPRRFDVWSSFCNTTAARRNIYFWGRWTTTYHY